MKGGVGSAAVTGPDGLVVAALVAVNAVGDVIDPATGQVVAGVIGKKKFIYDLWGDTVNIASRMESSGQPGMIQVSRASHALLKDAFAFESRGEIDIKGRGKMETFQLLHRLEGKK